MRNRVVLLYHEVSDLTTESGFQNEDNLPYIHSISQFSRDLDIIEEVSKIVNNEIIFTFDDGGISNLRAAKLLKEKDEKGYFFITTSKIGTSCFLDKQGVLEIDKMGHTIGSHSHTHPMIFKSLPYHKMLEEWKVSKDILENILGKKVEVCSIPGGDSDSKTYESALEAGFSKIFDSEPIMKKRNLYELEIIGRISIKNSTSEKELRKILTTEAIPRLQRIRMIKKVIKTIFFPLHSYLQNKKNETTY